VLEQIQLALGHQSIQATQRYLGSELDLAYAARDRLAYLRGLSVPKELRVIAGADASNRRKLE
jgi:hypothetical protein